MPLLHLCIACRMKVVDFLELADTHSVSVSKDCTNRSPLSNITRVDLDLTLTLLASIMSAQYDHQLEQ